MAGAASQPSVAPVPEDGPSHWQRTWRRLLAFLVLVLVAVVVVLVVIAAGDRARWSDWLFVVLLGMGVGTGELVSRYRDAPERAILTPAAALYIGLNGLASVAALGLLRTFDITLGIDKSSPAPSVRWVQVLLGGTGSMAFLRSAFFSVRVGDKDVAVGPAGFLQILLDACDRQVDRARAADRSQAVKRLMDTVSFDRGVYKLHSYCVSLMQNFPSEEGQRVASRIEQIAGALNVDDRTKAFNLGLTLMTAFGMDVLDRAVHELGPAITRQPLSGVATIVHGRSYASLGGVAQLAAAISGAASQDELVALRDFVPDTSLPEATRVLTLAYRIAAITGEDALKAALLALSEQAAPLPPSAPPPANGGL